MKTLLKYVFLMGMLIGLSNCKKDPVATPAPAGHLKISFEHYVDGNPVDFDTMKYVNAAGNHYQISVIQYFVTDLKLYKDDGSIREIKDWTDYFYVDTDLPDHLEWSVFDSITPGNYDSLSFRVGYSMSKNESFMFVNDPERNMVWPEYLGGGYHYFKMEGKYMDTNNVLRTYAFHIGLGQNYDSNGNIVPPFIDNSMPISLPASSFTITKDQTTKIGIRMNVENWFQNPAIFDFNVHGGDIMQKQDAMEIASKNAQDVFSFLSF